MHVLKCVCHICWSANHRLLEKFTDFKLHIEFKIPKRGNSGIYLRGRYEIQLGDDHDRALSVGSTGGVYGFLMPGMKAVNPTDEWNVCDVTMTGRWITIDMNGHRIIDNKEIPGITGGALDPFEAEPGPLMRPPAGAG